MFNFLKTSFNYNFESEDDNFQIKFPHEPQMDAVGGTNMYRFGFGDEAFMVMVNRTIGFSTIKSYDEAIGLENDTNKLKKVQKKELAKRAEAAESSHSGVLKEELKFMSSPSIELRYFNSKHNFYVVNRIFYVGDTLYEISVGKKKEKNIEELFARFVETFKLL